MRRGGAGAAALVAGLALAAAAALTGCGSNGNAGATGARMAPRGSCHVHAGLPDPRCTPGAVDPAVTQATIRRTICSPAWLRAHTPSSVALAGLERRQIAAYGAYAGPSPRDYQEDALIPVELGGAGTDPRNLWPQALTPAPAAAQKDDLERKLHRDVCAGATSLASARQIVGRNWRDAYLEAFE